MYIAIGRYGYVKLNKNTNMSDIINFQVTDEFGKTYEYVNNYDSSVSKENMKNKCGLIQTEEGTKAYWGVKEDGVHEYTIKYQISNFIKEFKEEGITKGINYDFIDEQVLTVIDLRLVAENYKFTEDNTKLINYNKKDSSFSFEEDGSLKLNFDPYYFEGDEKISFDENAPFSVGISNLNNSNPSIKTTKKQDILVIVLIIITAAVYIFVDLYRSIYEYKNLERKYNAVK